MSDFRPKKSLGQHFLIDRGIARRIVEAAELTSEDLVLEVGPGRGALTGLLLERAGKVIGVEIDRGLCGRLREEFGGDGRFTLLEADILEADLSELLNQFGCDKIVVVGNLPYNITSPLIFKLLTERSLLKRAVLMIQREVARRLIAGPGGKDYGILSLAVRLYTLPQLAFDVGRDSFRPRPQVDSSVVKMEFLGSSSVCLKDEGLFFDLIKVAFGQRRKMLRNSLLSLYPGRLGRGGLMRVSEDSGIDLSRRPETLSLEEFARLSDVLAKARDACALPHHSPRCVMRDTGCV